jgi:hypothetical protein
MRRSRERPPQLPDELRTSADGEVESSKKPSRLLAALKRAAKDAILRQTSTKRR